MLKQISADELTIDKNAKLVNATEKKQDPSTSSSTGQL